MTTKRGQQVNGFFRSGLTIWSYIKYRLHISSPEHAQRVRSRIRARINALAREGRVRPAKSKKGKRTYILTGGVS